MRMSDTDDFIVSHISKVAETAIEIPANTQVSNELDNQLVSLTGTLKSSK